MFRLILLTALTLALPAGPLFAQSDVTPDVTSGAAPAGAVNAGEVAGQPAGEPAGEPVVRVDITDVGTALADGLGVEADALPRSVEVPIDVAATACNIPAEQLEHFRAAEQHIECNATTLTPELTAAARDQLEP